MQRQWIGFCVFVMLGCDTLARSTLRLAPSTSTPAASNVEVTRQQADALKAVERLALQFGLTEIDMDGCEQAWELRGFRRGGKNLVVCAQRPSLDVLDVTISEINGWSAEAERLQAALTDTLARFGRVQATGRR